MPLEGEEDRSALQGIPDGSDNMRGGGAVARAKYCPRSQNRLGLVGRTRAGVGNMDMASIPLAGGTVVE
jgi:hypothetical protein